MTDYEMHEPKNSGTTTEEWDAPQMEDFATDDLSKIDNHFVLSSSGFPPETFTDLKAPIVHPDGDLLEGLSQNEFDEDIGTRIPSNGHLHVLYPSWLATQDASDDLHAVPDVLFAAPNS